MIYEGDCIRTVTFFKIPVYKLNMVIDANSNENREDLLKMIGHNDWSIKIFPIRRVNIQHLSNSLVQKLTLLSELDNNINNQTNRNDGGKVNNLGQIFKFRSLLPHSDVLKQGDVIEFSCTKERLSIQKNNKVLGEMENVSICNLLSRVYLDLVAFGSRGIPCPDLITNLNQQITQK